VADKPGRRLVTAEILVPDENPDRAKL